MSYKSTGEKYCGKNWPHLLFLIESALLCLKEKETLHTDLNQVGEPHGLLSWGLGSLQLKS